MWSVTDEALLAGMTGGDDAAAAEFVARFQRRVFGLARLITRDDRIAEDVAQEALIRAWRHGATYDPRRGSVATWLLTITRNLAIDELRVRRPGPLDPHAILDVIGASRDRGPSEHAEIAADIEQLRRALTRLPVEQQRAVVLAGLLGLTGLEVAEHENIALGTAKTRIRTAMQRLRELLVRTERLA